MKFFRFRAPPGLSAPDQFHLLAKDMEIDRLVRQGEQLALELQVTVARISETLSTHEHMSRGQDGRAADPGDDGTADAG